MAIAVYEYSGDGDGINPEVVIETAPLNPK
jgi:hypothetical protein